MPGRYLIRSLLFCTLLFSYATHLEGQFSSISTITEEEGLSYRWVFDITQDKQGFIWLATFNGLNRYDGHSFDIYQHSETDTNSISSNRIGHLTVDQQGNIWTYGRDLIFNKLDVNTNHFTKTNTHFKNYSRYSGTIPSMRYFASLQNGDFIVLFQESDLSACSFWKYLPDQNTFTHLMDVPTNATTINFFSEHADGKVWLWGMGAGYYQVDLNNKQFELFPVQSTGLTTTQNVAIPIDRNRNFWYPAYPFSEANQANDNRLDSFTLPPEMVVDSITNIRLDNHGNIWLNHKKNELFYYNRESRRIEKFEDPLFGMSTDVRSMDRFFVDQEGIVWHGNFFGAYKFSLKPKLFRTYLNSPSPVAKNINAVSARDIIEISGDSLLVRNNNYDLFLIDLKANSVKPYIRQPKNSLESNISTGIISMFISHDGYLWVNQRDKLIKTEIKTGLSETYRINTPIGEEKYTERETLPRIFEDASHTIWFCHMNGLFTFDTQSKTLIPVKLDTAGQSVKLSFDYASFDTHENAIYGSYPGGIFILDCRKKSVSLVEIYSTQELGATPTAILKWNNEFWLSTEKGLIRYNPMTKEQKIYTRKDGLPSDMIYSALSAENDLWLATHNGLCQFNPYTMQMANYYVNEGLPHNEFNRWSYLKTKNGQLFFGGLNGIIGFNPGDFKIPEIKTGQLHLIEYAKYNESKDSLIQIKKLFGPDEEIILGAKERNITFTYALNLFSDVNKNQYFHYLQGYESKWIEDGNLREVRYSKIPPGHYIFKVKASGPNKLPAVNEISIPVHVKQYWYLRWWALSAYFMLLLFAGIALYRYMLHRKLEMQEALAIKELGQAKTKMYTNITHEFRTPLTVILGMNEVVREKTLQGKSGEALKATSLIERSGKNLLQLVNQMLELTKLESGLLEVHNLQEDIIGYLRYRLEAFQHFAREKEIEIKFTASEKELMMDFDADKVSQILNNLISNAIKFTPGKGSISVHAEKVMDAQSSVFLKISITDTGIGIAKDKIDQVFDRFYQVDNPSAEKNKGTGIGLALVKDLVNLLNGKITLHSEPGKGSTFTVELPVHNEAPYASLRVPETLPSDYTQMGEMESGVYTEMESGMESETLVLIVEDNSDVSHYINTCLEGHYKTVLAQDGREGIEKAIDLVPDIIITDVMMPYKNGYELCSAIKKDERTSHIPVVILTSKADDESKIEGLEHGADVFLAKPFNRKELLVRLKNLLALRAELQKRYAQVNFSEAITTDPTGVDPFLIKIKTVVLAHLEDEGFDVTQLCLALHISRAQLHRKIIALTGHSTTNLIRSIRLEKARELLDKGQLNVTEVAYQTGFKTQAHFSRVFSEAFGKPPSDYRKK